MIKYGLYNGFINSFTKSQIKLLTKLYLLGNSLIMGLLHLDLTAEQLRLYAFGRWGACNVCIDLWDCES